MQRENWEALLNNAQLGVHLVSGEGIILWANDCELAALGYSREEYVGKSIADFHADPDVISKILEILTGGGHLQAYPARLRAKDGSLHHVLINSNVYAEDGSFCHTRCFTTEISSPVYEVLRAELLSE